MNSGSIYIQFLSVERRRRRFSPFFSRLLPCSLFYATAVLFFAHRTFLSFSHFTPFSAFVYHHHHPLPSVPLSLSFNGIPRRLHNKKRRKGFVGRGRSNAFLPRVKDLLFSFGGHGNSQGLMRALYLGRRRRLWRGPLYMLYSLGQLFRSFWREKQRLDR